MYYFPIKVCIVKIIIVYRSLSSSSISVSTTSSLDSALYFGNGVRLIPELPAQAQTQTDPGFILDISAEHNAKANDVFISNAFSHDKHSTPWTVDPGDLDDALRTVDLGDPAKVPGNSKKNSVGTCLTLAVVLT
jgi:hypothetical protein